MRTILLAGLLLYSTTVQADNIDYLKCQNSTIVELSNKIPFFTLLGKTSEKINAAKKLIQLNRILTPEEKAAIKSFLVQNQRCEKIKSASKDGDTYPRWFSLELLEGGFINLAQFGRLQLEELTVYSLFQDWLLKGIDDLIIERDELKKELSRRTEELSRNTMLSCVVESGLEKAVGLEFLFQVNEINKTITSNRGGGAPITSVVIGETSIYFKQNEMQTTISRATGKFTTGNSSLFLVGTCKKIAQRAF